MGGCLSTSTGSSDHDLELHHEAEKQLKEVRDSLFGNLLDLTIYLQTKAMLANQVKVRTF